MDRRPLRRATGSRQPHHELSPRLALEGQRARARSLARVRHDCRGRRIGARRGLPPSLVPSAIGAIQAVRVSKKRCDASSGPRSNVHYGSAGRPKLGSPQARHRPIDALSQDQGQVSSWFSPSDHVMTYRGLAAPVIDLAC
jgi:hypothetical protein